MSNGIPKWLSFTELQRVPRPDKFGSFMYKMTLNTNKGHIFLFEDDYAVELEEGVVRAFTEQEYEILFSSQVDSDNGVSPVKQASLA